MLKIILRSGNIKLGIQIIKTFIIILTFAFNVSNISANTSTMEKLSEGITAFLCEDGVNLENEPYIFIEDNDGWNLNGSPKISVNKTDKGFMLKFPEPLEGIGLFTESKDKDGSWKFEYLGEGGSIKKTCSIQNDFAFILIKTLIPKIVKNVDQLVKNAAESIEAKDKVSKELMKEKRKSRNFDIRLERLQEKLESNQKKLKDTLYQLEFQKQLAKLKNVKPDLVINPEILSNFIDKIKLCWNPPTNYKRNVNYIVTLGVKLSINGNLEEDPVNLSPNSGVEALQAYEAARRAVVRCQPYELPPDEYEYWQELEIKFNPAAKKLN
jgi:hypothetical protein